ncbi:MerR family transcriptional regulator [Micromonospora sp. NPDC048898]|uniref:helix-turn-helix domain-containing protein n=1 Tax=Micromonospora sp. NPDC048898 TaxID=3364260 RepID=UPI003710EDBA
MRTDVLRIGAAAERLGVTTHLLRHWEAEGVIEPPRTAGGARLYDNQLLDALAIAIRCQEAGMRLDKIAQLLNGDRRQRIELISDQRDAINRQRDRLTRTASFLDHVLECSHPVVRDCPACHDFLTTTT